MTGRRGTTRRLRVAALAVLPALALLTPGPARAAGSAPGRGPAPGRPGTAAPYLPSDKAGFGTAHSLRSTVWYTLQPGGGTGELYYPDLGTPAARSLSFVVVDRAGTAVRVADAATSSTVLTDGRSLGYRQTDTDRHGGWRLVSSYVTDPQRSTVMVDVRFTSLDHRPYRLYVVYEPALSNTPSDDSGRTAGTALVASDAHAASALLGHPAFTATSTGYRGTSDSWADLAADGRMDRRYSSAGPGNLVQTGRTALTGLPHHQQLSLVVGFATSADAALRAARASQAAGFDRTARAYAAGWHAYLDTLGPVPASLGTEQQRREYRVSELVLAASEDKLHRGAYVASPSMPWAWGAENPSGPYHLVWSRDLYQIATALIADGDWAGANRALDFLFGTQQKPDGSFPQNSTVAGAPFWTGLQLDEVALPIVLAYQLRRFDAATWTHVQRAADFLIGFTQDGNAAPWSPQDRWENQSGYSPATIASEIAGLVCAAVIARANGDTASATRYLHTADALAGASEGLDGHFYGAVLGKALLPAFDQGRQAGSRYHVLDRGQRAERCRPAQRGGPELPGAGPARRAARRRPRRGQQRPGGGPAAVLRHRPRPVLAPSFLRRLRRDRNRRPVDPGRAGGQLRHPGPRLAAAGRRAGRVRAGRR